VCARRPGKIANNRVPIDMSLEMPDLLDAEYLDYSAKHFGEKLVTRHRFSRSRNRTCLMLRSHGGIKPLLRR